MYFADVDTIRTMQQDNNGYSHNLAPCHWRSELYYKTSQYHRL